MKRLAEVLRQAQDLGFLGSAPVDEHIGHAEGFATALGALPRRALDLGSGGGLPGLVLARRWPDSEWVLLDANQRRTAFLTQAVSDLGIDRRVAIVRGRAEALARDRQYRGQFDLVTSRGFGPPAVTAECATGFLQPGGQLVVSEPPEEVGPRWDPDGLAELGMEPGAVVGGRPRYQVIHQRSATPDRFPRRAPQKRPLF